MINHTAVTTEDAANNSQEENSPTAIQPVMLTNDVLKKAGFIFPPVFQVLATDHHRHQIGTGR
ncbi:MAG: hypothetical protein C4330_01125 [Chitinophagaceae bacterium]